MGIEPLVYLVPDLDDEECVALPIWIKHRLRRIVADEGWLFNPN